MYITYDKKKGKLYAKLGTSTRQGAKVNKTYNYLGLVLDKDNGIYQSRKLGVFHYDLSTNTYNCDRKWAEIYAPETLIPKPVKKTQKEINKEEGEDRYASLLKILAESNRIEDITRTIDDKSYRKQLISELLP
jgi:putative ubiquitin-RnfH superfamily antitoxin RatB of RatAB toxin-antitoxin module